MSVAEKVEKRTNRIQGELFNDINKSYVSAGSDIEDQVNKIFDKLKYTKEGRLKTKRKLLEGDLNEVRKIVQDLWRSSGTKILTSSSDIINETLLIYEFVGMKQLGFKKGFDINDITLKSIKKRNKKINFNNVINSQSNKLSKRLNRELLKAARNGESEAQTLKRIKGIMKNNSGMARTVARTETNYYRSESQLISARETQKRGTKMQKEWVYSYRSRERRDSHVQMDGKVIGLDSDFRVNGKRTSGPQHFGEASEDINCNCRVRPKHAEKVDDSLKGLKDYKANRPVKVPKTKVEKNSLLNRKDNFKSPELTQAFDDELINMYEKYPFTQGKVDKTSYSAARSRAAGWVKHGAEGKYGKINYIENELKLFSNKGDLKSITADRLRHFEIKWSSTPSPVHTVRHEFAHIIDNVVTTSDPDFKKIINKMKVASTKDINLGEYSDLFFEYKKVKAATEPFSHNVIKQLYPDKKIYEIKKLLNDEVSRYSSSSLQEGFAELVSKMENGDTDEVTKRFTKIFNKELKERGFDVTSK